MSSPSSALGMHKHNVRIALNRVPTSMHGLLPITVQHCGSR